MQIGELITTKSINALFENEIAKGSLTYKANKGKVLVFMYMGTEDQSADGEKIDGREVFAKLGWTEKG